MNNNIEDTSKEQIKNLKREIEKFHAISNNEIIWLFAATIGCWGIPDEHPIYQLVAFMISFIIFFSSVKEKLGEIKPFKEKIVAIKNQLLLNMSIESDFVKARFFDLQEIENKYFSVKYFINDNKIFFMCWMFCGLSLLTIFIEFPLKF